MTRKMTPERKALHMAAVEKVIEQISKERGGCTAPDLNQFQRQFIRDLEAAGRIEWLDGHGWIIRAK